MCAVASDVLSEAQAWNVDGKGNYLISCEEKIIGSFPLVP